MFNKLPSTAWAIALAFLGVVVALCSLFFLPAPENIKLKVLEIAGYLVTGALGAFAGHASATSDNKITGSNPVINQTPVIPPSGTTETKEQ
jgi:hypothetical protein